MNHFQSFLRDIGLDRATREDYKATIGEIKSSHSATFRQYYLVVFAFVIVLTPMISYFGFLAAASVPGNPFWVGSLFTAFPLIVAVLQTPAMERTIWRQIRDAKCADADAPQAA